jgi:putative ABC transport system substrate-binding protein
MTPLRRCLLSLGLALLLPREARAQAPVRIYRLAALFSTPAASSGPAVLSPLTKEVEALGYVQGKNLIVEGRWAEGDLLRLPTLASELVRLRPDILYTAGTPAARAAKEATSTIPIVIGLLSDPVSSGLVQSLDRPGGNVTGVTNLSLELAGKQMELLHAILPSATRIAVLWMVNANAHPLMLAQAEKAAKDLRLTILPVSVNSAAELNAAFAEMARNKANALVVPADPILYSMRRQIAEQRLKAKLPTMFAYRGHVQLGGLASYGENYAAAIALQARYIDQLLRGAKPADLPIQQPTDFELVVNMKAARALGIAIPRSVVLLANEIID